MPRPNPPPTPGSSTDLRGKEGEAYAPAFRLPPTAYYEDAGGASNRSSPTPSANGSDESYTPASPAGDAPRSSKAAVETGVMTREDFALPPPPTRSRKIIQMRPQTARPTQEGAGASAAGVPPQAATRGQTAVTGGGKRKGNASGQTAAGRKTARKTAHSLIERRRRSKMNDEFGVLRDMIPACRGQEMHKLAILQASIEYLRYLEQCVSDLQAKNNSPRPAPPSPAPNSSAAGARDDDDGEDELMDDENDNAEQPGLAPTPRTATGMAQTSRSSIISLPPLSQMITASTTSSPPVFSSDARRQQLTSSTSQASFSPYIHSAHTSPAFGPQLSQLQPSAPLSGIGSPALNPADSESGHPSWRPRPGNDAATALTDRHQLRSEFGLDSESKCSDRELDQEAATALSMLNHDRRGWKSAQYGLAGGVERSSGNASYGGMSVRDLLSG